MSWQLILIGSFISVSIMLFLWLLHLAIRNAAIVDVGWVFIIGLLGVFYSFYGSGSEQYRLLGGAMSFLWSIRLSLHLLFSRIIGKQEEGRYRKLRQDWKTNISFRFLLFFQIQAAVAVVFSIPAFLISGNSAKELSILSVIGGCLFLAALSFEAISDWQLETFKKDPKNKGLVCDKGLWRYSRHPNYFFEWLVWCCFALVALSSPNGYAGVVVPSLLLFFLFKVTGIPATEVEALRSRGEAYERYQKTTSPFVPWPNKANAP